VHVGCGLFVRQPRELVHQPAVGRVELVQQRLRADQPVLRDDPRIERVHVPRLLGG